MLGRMGVRFWREAGLCQGSVKSGCLLTPHARLGGVEGSLETG